MAYSEREREFTSAKNYNADYNQISHSAKDHQLCFLDGLNTRKTKPRWCMAGRHLEKLKNGHINDRHEIWQDDKH